MAVVGRALGTGGRLRPPGSILPGVEGRLIRHVVMVR